MELPGALYLEGLCGGKTLLSISNVCLGHRKVQTLLPLNSLGIISKFLPFQCSMSRGHRFQEAWGTRGTLRSLQENLRP